MGGASKAEDFSNGIEKVESTAYNYFKVVHEYMLRGHEEFASFLHPCTESE